MQTIAHEQNKKFKSAKTNHWGTGCKKLPHQGGSNFLAHRG